MSKNYVINNCLSVSFNETAVIQNYKKYFIWLRSEYAVAYLFDKQNIYFLSL